MHFLFKLKIMRIIIFKHYTDGMHKTFGKCTQTTDWNYEFVSPLYLIRLLYKVYQYLGPGIRSRLVTSLSPIPTSDLVWQRPLAIWLGSLETQWHMFSLWQF